MSRGKLNFDKPFFVSVVILTIAGFIIFYSASLGILARNSEQYSSITFSQAVLGLLFGSLGLLFVSRLDYKILRRYAFWILLGGVILNILVLFPQIGVEHNGARRWIYLGPLSLQTSELLKLGFVIYLAAWASKAKERMSTFKQGLLPLVILLSVSGFLLLKQPDTDTFLLLATSLVAIFLISGGRWKHILLLIFVGAITLTFLALTRPYVMSRIQTFLNPEREALGAGYQIQQSLIAIGSGGFWGRGFGQSVQKFDFLPEPMGDSIFAVEAEEFGFVGAVGLILLFVFFAVRGLKIASQTLDPFGRLLVVGLVIMITAQAFVNMGAMLGILPLSGITLPFVSHGGTSLFITLVEAGIILSVSRSNK